MRSNDRSKAKTPRPDSAPAVHRTANGFSMAFEETGQWHKPVRPNLWERIKEDWRLGGMDPSRFKRGDSK